MLTLFYKRKQAKFWQIKTLADRVQTAIFSTSYAIMVTMALREPYSVQSGGKLSYISTAN